MRGIPAANLARPDGDRRLREDLGVDEAASPTLAAADACSTEYLDADPAAALDDVHRGDQNLVIIGTLPSPCF